MHTYQGETQILSRNITDDINRERKTSTDGCSTVRSAISGWVDGIDWIVSGWGEVQGVFLTGTPTKKLKYGKPRLGESTLT